MQKNFYQRWCLSRKLSALTILMSLSYLQAYAGKAPQASPTTGFIENKGQITDQNRHANPSVKYLLNMPGLNVQLKQNSFSYDAYTAEIKQKLKNDGSVEEESVIYNFHRIDIEFIGANPSPEMVAEKAAVDFLNFYLEGAAENGVLKVSHYGKVTYKNLYPGIDLEFLARPGSNKPVEYNFIVHPGADISLIKWKYLGSNAVKLDNGQVQIKTAHGNLLETVPLTYELESSRPVELAYRNLSPGIFAFDVKTYDKKNTLIIDPIPDLKWGTYFGGALVDNTYGIAFDATGNMLVTGATTSVNAIATAGAYQITMAGSAGYGAGGDAFVVKFDAAGTRLWGTYFGGANNEIGQSIKVDNLGNIYVLGTTSSTAGISTAGTFQLTFGGGGYNDPFLVKFDATGARVWGTYYGGTGNDRGTQNGMVLDATGNIYITGTNNTANSTFITTPGVYKTTNGATAAYDDPFVAKFSPAGSLIWGTYVGGPLHDQSNAITLDGAGNIYITGAAGSTTMIATAGAHQTTLGGGTSDAFVAKLNPTGTTLLWATYYGGTAVDAGTGVQIDATGNIIVAGYAGSTTGISTTTTTYGGGTYDAFLVKFNSFGIRQWGTYLGGSGDDVTRACRIDGSGNIYMAGDATSASGIASPGTYQTVYGGGTRDCYLSKHNNNGTLLWSTYYGGNAEELPWSMEIDVNANLFMVGRVVSPNAITTAGAYQTTYGGGTYDGFIARFQEQSGNHNAGVNKMTNPGGFLCAGGQDVKVEITNAGFNTINTVTINWEIDGASQTSVLVNTPVLSGTSREITLATGVNFPANTSKTIKIWTSMPNGVADTITNNDTITVMRRPGLSGTYTIGGTTPDYATFAAAVADLNAYGVCGPVVFQVRAGTYTERISLNQVTGSSPVNTITFLGSGVNTTTITSLGTNATDLATILLNGTDHTTFRDMSVNSTGNSFGAGIWLVANADSNRFINLSVSVDTVSNSANINAIVASGNTGAIADGATGNFNLFDSLVVKGGYHGIRINGMNTTTNYVFRNKISNSSFSKQYMYGVYLKSQSHCLVANNIIDSLRNTSSYGIYMDYSANIEISNNQVKAKDIGMYFNYVNRYLYNSGVQSRVFNNMASSNTNSAFSSVQSAQLKIWHNSFNSEASHSVVRFATSLTMDVRNNHMLNRSTTLNTYVMHADNSNTFGMVDYNNYFSTSGFIYVGSSHYANMPVLQAAFPTFNQNSYTQDPLFISNSDLHTSINLSGTYVGIDEDIDRDFRNNTSPVLGADEANIPNNAGISKLLSPTPVFCAGVQDVKVQIGNYGINAVDSVRVYWQVNGVMQPVTYISSSIAIRGFLDVTLGTLSFNLGESKDIKIWTSMPNGVNDPLRNNDTLTAKVRTGLSGKYTIGGTNPDYADFNQAAYDLNMLGVCSPVTFEVRPGTYSERLNLGEIRGASHINTITFKGAGKNNTNLSFSGTGTGDWITLLLNGADHLVFRDMTISSMGANFGIAALLTNKADSNKFINVTIQTSTTSTSLNLVGLAVISSTTDLYAPSGFPGDGNLFDSLEVNGGYYGLYLTGSSLHQTVSNSVFNDQYISSVFCSSQDYLKVNNNRMNPLRNTGFSYSLNLSQTANFEVFSNTINTGGDYGIYFQTTNLIGRDPAFVSKLYNNMVCNTAGYAFYCENSEYIRIFHNSFRSVGTSNLIAGAAYFASSVGMDMRNNHIRNDNPNSFAMFSDQGTFDSLDYNNYYSFGSFVRIGATYSNISNLKTGLPLFNQNSYSQDPKFVSITNLHTNIFLAGKYVQIDRDIDGEARCPQNVSVGADDENQGFAKPVISTNHTDFFTNYPVRFTHNIAGQPGTVYKWYIDGVYINDSVSLLDKFTNAGSYRISLHAQRCIYRDSTEFILVVAPGDNIITLNGKTQDSSRVFNTYTDQWVVAKDFLGQDLTPMVTSGTNVDTSVLGSYHIWYKVQDAWGNKDSVVRTVEVIDDVAPAVVLIDNDTIVMEVFGHINDPGAIVTDNYFTNLTAIVDSADVNKSVVGFYKMVYTAIDGSGNVSKIVRWVKVVDTGLPLIKLLGPDTIKVDVFSLYVEIGAKVSDIYCTSGLTWEVDIYPSTETLTEYILTYTATDCQGNHAIPVTRVVRIVDRERPEIELNGFANVEHMRWMEYNDDGVSISDNYYSENDLMLLVDTTSNLDVNRMGNYSVCYQVTDPSGNKSAKVCRMVTVIDNITSVKGIGLQENVRLYPNPNNGRFILDLGSALNAGANVSVYDVTGREVYSSVVSQQQTELILEHLSAGVYQVRLQQGAEMVTLRVNIIR